MEFSGRLAAFPPGDLLQWAQNDRRTGALVVRRSSREKRVSFVEGQVVGCLSDDPAEFFGQHLLLNGLVTEKDLIQALTQAERTGQRLGARLLEMRVLSPDQLNKALRAHVQDLVCDLFLWSRGVFYFEAAVPDDGASATSPPLDTMNVVMEGARWADEHARIRRVFVHDEILLKRRRGVTPQGLTALESFIFGKVNDRRTVAQLYRATGGSYFRFLQASLALCVREVLDLGEMSPTAVGVATTHEINLYDLMREQASEDQLLAMHRGASIPFAAVDRMVPLWVGGETADEREAELARRLNGTNRMREVIAADSSPELDLFLRALQKGAIALLPAPLAELEAVAATPESIPGRWWQNLRRTLPRTGTKG